MAEYKNVAELTKQIADFKKAVNSLNSDYMTGYLCALSVTEGIIASIPTADVVEVKHGYWKKVEEPLGVRDVTCAECSVCGESWIVDEDLSFEELTEHWNYCINCGAKMDKRSEGK